MYLRLGNNAVIRSREVLGIFDLDTASASRRTRDFLAKAERQGQIHNAAGGELPKSFVLCAGGKPIRSAPGDRMQGVYLSQLNSSTLAGRWEESLRPETGAPLPRPARDTDTKN